MQRQRPGGHHHNHPQLRFFVAFLVLEATLKASQAHPDGGALHRRMITSGLHFLIAHGLNSGIEPLLVLRMVPVCSPVNKHTLLIALAED